jgi:hypothetical protein
MGNLIRPTTVNVVTKDGECTIHLTLDINLNLNSDFIKSNNISTESKEEENEKTIWTIPTFKSHDKVKFGKKE